jgi:hypothetical protein
MIKMINNQLTIYTPGHSFYTDTLIAYGLIYPLLGSIEDLEERLEVYGTGLNYMITIKNVDLKHLAELMASGIKNRLDRLRRELMYVSRSEAKTYADGRVGLFNEKDVSSFIKALEDVDGLKRFLESLQFPTHALEEGKTTAGKIAKSKLKLPLMPTAGKYLHEDLTITNKFSDNKYYRVCDYCAAFTAVGLCCGALIAKWDKWALILTLGFEGSVGGGTIQYMVNLIENEAMVLGRLLRDSRALEGIQESLLSLELSRSLDVIPLRTLVQAILCLFTDSAIKGLSESNASWKALSVKFDASRVKSGNLQIRGYEEIILDSVINALAYLLQESITENKIIIEDLREKIRKLLRASRSRGPESGDAIIALESLFTFFQTRRLSDLYSFVRSFEVSMRRSSSKYAVGLSSTLCRTLASLSVML